MTLMISRRLQEPPPQQKGNDARIMEFPTVKHYYYFYIAEDDVIFSGIVVNGLYRPIPVVGYKRLKASSQSSRLIDLCSLILTFKKKVKNLFIFFAPFPLKFIDHSIPVSTRLFMLILSVIASSY